MAFLATLFALGSRFATKIVTTSLGWASTLLFGRVPQSRQFLLLGITFGSVIWMVLVAGIVFPDIGTFLLVLIPSQGIIPETTIRLAMLVGALVVPAVVGVITMSLAGDGRAPRTPRSVAVAVLRGYPLTVLLSGLLVFLAVLAIYRKVVSLARRWTDAHVPLIVEPGAYDEVAADLARAVGDAGLEVTPTPAPAVMSAPARWLAAVAGGSGSLVPERMVGLHGAGLDILIYPMDLLISGKPRLVARARAAMASRLTTSAAHLTVSAEAQAVEDRLANLARGQWDGVNGDRPDHDPGDLPRYDAAAEAAFSGIDETLATLEIPYEEWEVLYRQRLQVERDLRARAMTFAEDGGRGGPVVETLKRLVEAGAGVVVEVAADKHAAESVERTAGLTGRVMLGVAGSAAGLIREAIQTDDGKDDVDDDVEAEPAAGRVRGP